MFLSGFHVCRSGLSNTMMSHSRGGAFATERSFRLVPLVLVVASLCILSFYMGNLYDSAKSNISEEIKVGEQVKEKSGNCLQTMKQDPFPECNITLQDMTPCTDPKVINQFGVYWRMTHANFYWKPICMHLLGFAIWLMLIQSWMCRFPLSQSLIRQLENLVCLFVGVTSNAG